MPNCLFNVLLVFFALVGFSRYDEGGETRRETSSGRESAMRVACTAGVSKQFFKVYGVAAGVLFNN